MAIRTANRIANRIVAVESFRIIGEHATTFSKHTRSTYRRTYSSFSISCPQTWTPARQSPPHCPEPRKTWSTIEGIGGGRSPPPNYYHCHFCYFISNLLIIIFVFDFLFTLLNMRSIYSPVVELYQSPG